MAVSTARSLDKLNRDKQADLRKSSRFAAYPSDIHEMPGFNKRDYSRPKIQAHIRKFADLYKAGAHVPNITVRVVDGIIYVVEGHCRRRGMMLAIEEGADLGQQPLEEFRGDAEQAEDVVITSQMGEKLTAIELAEAYQRKINRGKSQADIAKLVGKSQGHISRLLEVITLPPEIKDLIHREVVSYNLALDTFNEMGSAATELLQEGAEEVLSKGKKKLTPKDVNNKRGVSKKLTPKMVTGMREQLGSIGSKLEGVSVGEDGKATVEFSKEEIEEFQTLLARLKEREANEAQQDEEQSEGADIEKGVQEAQDDRTELTGEEGEQ